MIRLEPRGDASLTLRIGAPVLAGALALALAAIPLAFSGAPLGRAYALLFEGALGSRLAITETLARCTPLVLTGLAVCVAFRARLYNIGGEGKV